MLLCGSFQNQVIRIINVLRFDEKQLSRMKGLENENPVALDDNALTESRREDDGDMQTDVNFEHEQDLEIDDDNDDIEDLETKDCDVQRKDWRRVRKIYKRSKQYIFVAATLPVNGKKTAGGVLKRMYPDASWVTGNYVHCHNPDRKSVV